jgi:DNA polymerase (family 10)
VARRIREVSENPDHAVLKSAISTIPRDLRNLVEAGLPLRLAVEICRLGATTSGDVAALIRDGRLDEQLSSSPELAAAIYRAQPQIRWAQPRIPLGRADNILAEVVPDIQERCPLILQLKPVGSFRRGDATVGDFHVLAVSNDVAGTVECVAGLPFVRDVLHRGAANVTIEVPDAEISVRVVRPDEFPLALIHYTGSAAHNEQLRAYARRKGFTLTSTSLRRATGAVVPCETEAAVYAALDLGYIPPELREGMDEIDAAAANALPDLVTLRHIRGDLHMHTDWSDGHDTVLQMARTARDLGYEYMAITDHSPSSAASRSLSLDGLARQADEIERVRRQVPDIAVLHGAEVDILPDGLLDFPDEMLARLDVVLASLHDAANHSRKELTARYIRAMRHPLVNIITHPANRLVGRREGYDLDEALLFRTAAETGTILEIDGAPGHLDMDGAMARRAVSAGVMVSVDSDCHRASVLERQMRFGVMTARRGWVEPRHVLNTRPWTEVKAILAAAKAGRHK